VYIVHRIRMPSQQCAIAVAPVGIELLAGGQTWLGQGGHRSTDLGEGGTGLVWCHWWARWRRFGR